jgi:hypothetical protein
MSIGRAEAPQVVATTIVDRMWAAVSHAVDLEASPTSRAAVRSVTPAPGLLPHALTHAAFPVILAEPSMRIGWSPLRLLMSDDEVVKVDHEGVSPSGGDAVSKYL